MVTCIKDLTKGSAIYFYYLTHPEDEFIREVMNGTIPEYIYEYQAHNACYRDIIKNQRMDIIHDIISNMSRVELEAVAKIAIEENNRELIELLYQNNFKANFYVHGYSDSHTFAYEKHGLEIIKFMKDVGFCLNDKHQNLFSHVISKNDKEAANYLIETSTKPIDEFFQNVLYCFAMNIKLLIELFMDKMDIMSHKISILNTCCGESVENIKSFLEYGVTIDSNEPLRFACLRTNLKLVEFYLQYGLQVDSDILYTALLGDDDIGRGASKPLVNLFLKYNIDFSIVTDDCIIDHAFLATLENSGLNKDILLPAICTLQEN